MLTLGEMVGKVCDLEGDSRLLRDLAVQSALSPEPVPHWVLVFGEVDIHSLWDGLSLGLCFGAPLSQL